MAEWQHKGEEAKQGLALGAEDCSDSERARYYGRISKPLDGPRQVKKYCPVEAESLKLLEMAVAKLGLSARAFDRVLKVARTVADLAGGRRPYALSTSPKRSSTG